MRYREIIGEHAPTIADATKKNGIDRKIANKMVDPKGYFHPKAPISERDNLSAWFSGSKVVDEHGQPKRMYHGSNTAFSSFDPDKANPNSLVGPGFYFTSSPEVAGGTGGAQNDEELRAKAAFNQAGYAFQGTKFEIAPLTPRQIEHFRRIFNSKQVEHDWRNDIGSRESWQRADKAFDQGPEALAKWIANEAPQWVKDRMKLQPVQTTTPTVYPVYLSIKHPFEMDLRLNPEEAQEMRRHMWEASKEFFEGGEHGETFENATGGYRGTKRDTYAGDVWEWMLKRVFSSDRGRATATLKRMGYDGIHHTGGRNIGTMGEHDVWVAFYPNQIKSVFAQKFDADSHDIGESR
jgi:hypothetical protein